MLVKERSELKSAPAVVEELLAEVRERNPHEPEFLQAVEEVVASLTPVIERHPEYQNTKML
jgi:glutamate dehydrogenase (NADP+)